MFKRFLIVVCLLVAGLHMYGAISVQSEHEHFIPQFAPQDVWRLQVVKSRDDGRYTAIWFKELSDCEQENLVIVASPFEENEPCFDEALQSFLAPIKDQIGVQWEIYEQFDHEAILGWRYDEEELYCVRMLMTSSALHFISYCYRGTQTAHVDVQDRIAFLKRAYVDADGLKQAYLDADELVNKSNC